MNIFLSEFVSNDQRQRKAVIYDQYGYLVELWENGRKVETRDCSQHTKEYAERCAQNWIDGIIR